MGGQLGDLALGQCLVTVLAVQRHGVLRPQPQPPADAEPTEPVMFMTGLGKGKSFRAVSGAGAQSAWQGRLQLSVARGKIAPGALAKLRECRVPSWEPGF